VNTQKPSRWLIPGISLLWLCLGVGLLGQEYRGRVQGYGTDPSNAAVAGATVTLRNVNTGVEAKTETDATGHYIFNFVQPGSYSVIVEAPGFNRFVQENVTVLTSGDVTVNAQLTLGAVTETVTVSAEVAGVQFNTSTMATTVQGSMLQNIPILARNPFTLALLNPAVINRYWDVAHRNPFYMWSSNGLDIGGRTGGKNDMLLDGVTLRSASARGSYMPPMDAVQEVAVQQNAVDAEYGFSAGGVLNVSMKSGTNDLHGTVYYFGRNPALNAITNRISRQKGIVRNHIWGATAGGPIKKNKLFFFQSYEQWRSTQPSSKQLTMPTELERKGDFSRSLAKDGSLRLIYDPFTTRLDSNTGQWVRQPFAGNVIPASRMDPTGLKIMRDLWGPNNPGTDLSGINNFQIAYAWWLRYWNISNRVDWYVTDKIRFYHRFSKYETRLDNPNWGGTVAVPSDNGGLMDAVNAAADLLYMITPSTTLNLRYGATYVEDDYDSQWAKVPKSLWADLWPTNWFEPILANLEKRGVGYYYPRFNFTGNGSAYTGFGSWWIVHERVHSGQLNLTHTRGIHNLKAGMTIRYSGNRNGQPGTAAFTFHAVDTGASFVGFDASRSGNMYASLLLGVVNSGSGYMRVFWDETQQQWAGYIQDDIKLTRRVTLNLGLRYEYETAPSEASRIFSRYLDLTNPIPELANNPPKMPAQVTAIAQIPYKWNGAWVYTDDKHPGVYDPQKTVFLPRVGAAIRINDLTALRVGWARYAVPILTIHPEGWNIPKDGFQRTTDVIGPISGVPQTFISNPFPPSNPLLLPVGKSLGRYLNLGDNATWFRQKVLHPINDRFNVSVQRQWPWRVTTDTTFFMNFGRNIHDASMWGGDYSLPLNLMDPELAYTYKAAVDQTVPNPFYQLLPPDKMPGTLRNKPTVAVRDLLKPYPQYGNLTERFMTGRKSHYYSLQFKAERPMAQGLTFSFGYNYSRESRSEWYDEVAQYRNQLTMIDTREPRHYLRIAGTWEVPVGRGRRFGSNMPKALDYVIGGWATSHFFVWNNGQLLTFGPMQCTGNPKIDNPTRQRWFDPTKCSVLPPYTRRTNPWYFDGLRGPGFWNWDATAVKYFQITERVKFELRMEFYNFPNAFMPSNPVTDVTSSAFGQSTWVAGGNYGREIQYTARIHF